MHDKDRDEKSNNENFKKKSDLLKEFITSEMKETIKNLTEGMPNINKGTYSFLGKVGSRTNNWLSVPYFCIIDTHYGTDEKKANGFYLAYLFKEKMDGIYLTLMWPNDIFEDLELKKDDMTSYIQDFLDFHKFKEQDIEYGPLERGTLAEQKNSKKGTPQQFEESVILAKYYPKKMMEDSSDLTDEKLLEDLKSFLNIYSFLKKDSYIEDFTNENEFMTDQDWKYVFENEILEAKMLEILKDILEHEDQMITFDDIKSTFEFKNMDDFLEIVTKNSSLIQSKLKKESIYNKEGTEIFWPRFFFSRCKEGNVQQFKLKPELINALKTFYHYPIEHKKEGEGQDVKFESFNKFLKNEGFRFNLKTIENYILSLKTKPFVILTGNSGTGKTKLAQLFAQYLYEKNESYLTDKNYEIVPVGANWTDNKNVLGFYNVLTEEYNETQTFKLIKRALIDKENPYFLILDEMNLSHVERYFADFLSAMESSESIPLYVKTIPEEDFKEYCIEIEEEYSHKLNDEDRERILKEYFTHERTAIQVISSDSIMSISESINLPENLFVIGTVNVDETTYMFSPKVLDRANVIEFETEYPNVFMNPVENEENINIEKFNELAEFKSFKTNFNDLESKLKSVEVKDNDLWITLSDELNNLYAILKESGFDFGYRVIKEILRFMYVAVDYDDNIKENWQRYFDAQIKQKILPKLHGSETVLGSTLLDLLDYCSNDEIKVNEFDFSDKKTYENYFKGNNWEDNFKYPSSAKKIKDMLVVLTKQRYVSFIN